METDVSEIDQVIYQDQAYDSW